MPQIIRKRSLQEEVQTRTQDGEVTINLNLRITIDGDSTIKIDATASPQSAGQVPSAPSQSHTEKPSETEDQEEERKVDIIPTELFANDDDLLDGFGS